KVGIGQAAKLVFRETETLAALRRRLLIPALATNDVEPAVAIHVSNGDGFGRTQIERVLTKRDRVVARRRTSQVDVATAFGPFSGAERWQGNAASRSSGCADTEQGCRNARTHRLQEPPSGAFLIASHDAPQGLTMAVGKDGTLVNSSQRA